MINMKVIELFAGVGGFRVALERANKHIGADYEVVWSNQWEPATKAQHASDTYVARFGSKGHSNEDIARVVADKIDSIPDHDLLVGGFPCQDYSVARTLSQAAGIEGKKGVLWWSIYGILDKKEHKPDYLMLENVDRLINSPASQRGRDFAIILASLADLGYIAEWRVVNAADYGFPQRRRRTFILAYRNTSKIGSRIQDALKWLTEDGVMAKAFPIKPVNMLLAAPFEIKGDLPTVTEKFNKTGGKTPFCNAGIIVGREVLSVDTEPNYDGPYTTLGDILLPTKDVPESFFIKEEDLPQWKYLKGPKSEMRKNSDGFEYHYSEGGMQFPDLLDKPSRTIITGEGGASPSRFKHVVQTEDGRFRRLTPIELERLDMFPDNHTAGVSDVKRAFFMGNALVVGAIQNMAESLYRAVNTTAPLPEGSPSPDTPATPTKKNPSPKNLTTTQRSNLMDTTALRMVYSRTLNTEALQKRNQNIQAFADLPREGLAFNATERRLHLYSTQSGEQIFIQYPGKESATTATTDPANIRPWDFRPKLILADGSQMNDLSFKDIWNDLERMHAFDQEALSALGALFFRMAFMVDHRYTQERCIFNDYTINQPNTQPTTGSIDFSWWKPTFNRNTLQEIQNAIGLIRGASLEAYLVYNDLLAQNEDCKYFYRSVRVRGEAWDNKTGRHNTLLTHLSVIGFLRGQLHFSQLMDMFQRGRGVAAAAVRDFPSFTNGIITME